MTAWDVHRPPDPDLIADCVHCGFCLPTCPSYTVFEDEMDTPRGRIVLMRVGNEPDSRPSDELRVHLDRCLGCMACVTACPSGVKYDQLIERARPQVERVAPRPRRERLHRRLIFALFTHPGRLRALAPVLWLQQKLGVNDALAKRLGRVPELQAMLRLAPPVTRRAAIQQLAEVTPAQGTRRGRIALMQGCVQRVFFGDVNAATVRVLAAEGFEVHAPRAAALLRRAPAARRRRGRGARARQGDDRRVRGLRARRGQRRRLRLRDEGLRAPARGRPGVGGPREGVRGEGARRERAARGVRAAGAAPSAADDRRLPRRLPPRPRAEGPRPAARAAQRHPGARAARARRVGALLRLRRDLQPRRAGRRGRARASARPRTCAPRAPRRSPPATPAARSRSARTSTSPSSTR